MTDHQYTEIVQLCAELAPIKRKLEQKRREIVAQIKKNRLSKNSVDTSVYKAIEKLGDAVQIDFFDDINYNINILCFIDSIDKLCDGEDYHDYNESVKLVKWVFSSIPLTDKALIAVINKAMPSAKMVAGIKSGKYSDDYLAKTVWKNLDIDEIIAHICRVANEFYPAPKINV